MRNRVHPIQKLLDMRSSGNSVGIPSFCTSNKRVLTAILRDAAKNSRTVLIEATVNQVNQFGGYTGMTPADFSDYIFQIAKEVGCPKERIVLGGDHLGPLPFVHEPQEIAMQRAEDLVRAYVYAGFSKIHLDTSMKLKEDGKEELNTITVASRGSRLCRAAEEAFREYRRTNQSAPWPIYVIGSEVPIPGGAKEHEETICPTRALDCHETYKIYQKIFFEYGLRETWDRIVGIVVQPGVEFGDNKIFSYNPNEAKELMAVLQDMPNLVFEGHSTDYQSLTCLLQMVSDGVVILKVGPELTFSLREALFALADIESQVLPPDEASGFCEVLEREMMANPTYWEGYYFGSEDDRRLARSYSLSDRARYYIGRDRVDESIEKLMKNINNTKIPIGLVHQFFPYNFNFINQLEVSNRATILLETKVMATVNRYYEACGLL